MFRSMFRMLINKIDFPRNQAGPLRRLVNVLLIVTIRSRAAEHKLLRNGPIRTRRAALNSAVVRVVNTHHSA